MFTLPTSEFPTYRRQAGPLEEGPSQLLEGLSSLRQVADRRVVINLGGWSRAENTAGVLGTKVKAVVLLPILPSNGNS